MGKGEIKKGNSKVGEGAKRGKDIKGDNFSGRHSQSKSKESRGREREAGGGGGGR